MKDPRNISTKRIWFILIDIVVIFILCGFGLKSLCNLGEYNKYLLDSNIKSVVQKSDGSIYKYDSNFIQPATGGDIVYFHIQLPDENPYPNTTVCAIVYNCETELISQNKTIFEYGKDIRENGGNLGNTFINATISDDVFGDEIIVKCTVPEGANLTKLENVRLMPSEYSMRYVLINHEIDFVFCICIAGVSIIGILLMITLGKFSGIAREGIYLFMFFLLTSLWVLGSNDMLYIFINNPMICSNLEYFSMFLMPVPFCLFLSLELKNKFRKIYLILSAFYAVIFFAVMALNIFGSFHFFRFTHTERILFVVGLTVTVFALLISKDNDTISKRIIKIGTICSICVMTIEVIRYELRDTSYLFRQLFSTSLSVFGIMIFVFSLFYGYYTKLSTEIMRKKSLEQVAFIDGMTGIANRNAVNGFLQALSPGECYSIIFFDVNDLKMANDKYGHEYGDKLITIVAAALKDSFEQYDGFYGRYGGDEFVAGFYNNAADITTQCIENFSRIIASANKDKLLPFTIRVAYGCYINNPYDPLDAELGIKNADEQMYEMKKQMKNTYSVL